MKVLRSTMYPPSIDEPITVVVSERSLRVSIEQAAAEVEQPGMFVVNDIFESFTADDVKLTLEGAERQRANAENERNMAISYYWNAATLTKVIEGGSLTNPQPAPLTVEQIQVVLRQLHRHPSYRKQTVMCVSRDFRFVTLHADGSIHLAP